MNATVESAVIELDASRLYARLVKDFASWPRFLAKGAGAAWSFAANRQIDRLNDRGEDSSLAILVLEARSSVAADAKKGAG